jgi:hypothetical protein
MEENKFRNSKTGRIGELQKNSFINFLHVFFTGPFYLLIASITLSLTTTLSLLPYIQWQVSVGRYDWIDISLVIIIDAVCLIGLIVAVDMILHTIHQRFSSRTDSLSLVTDRDTTKRLIYFAAEDAVFTERIYADLQRSGISCTPVQNGSVGEEEKRPLIFLRGYDQLLLVFSQQARSNAWIEQLVNTALRLEILRGRKTLFLLDVDEPAEIDAGVWSTTRYRSHKRENFIGWENPLLYRQALDRLIDDLRGQEL